LSAIGCRREWWTGLAENALDLLRDGLLTRGAKHAGGVDAMLLRELSGTDMDSALIEDCLHSLKDILSGGRRRGICILLAAHHHFDDFTQFHRRQIFGLLNGVDL
jgi:hypothetical protein